MEKLLKGDKFRNRYRITGLLKTLSPLHIGTGVDTDAVYSQAERERLQRQSKEKDKAKGKDKVPMVSTVMKDFQGRPLIPGSTLRGVLRHWLLSVLSGFGSQWADYRERYDSGDLAKLDQDGQIEAVKGFSWLELLFGTPFHEGKVEVWDAACRTDQTLQAPDTLLSWKPQSLTYIDTSVAIDPTTGTALENLLYKTEVVPPGVEFELTLAGQNLTDFELGLVLLGLQGFNSQIYPIQVGARGGRGYGRMCFTPGPVYKLDADGAKAWVAGIISSLGQAGGETSLDGAAGYFTLPELSPEEQQALIKQAKEQLQSQLGSQT